MRERNIYFVIAFTAVLCWSLWNYKVSLDLLDKGYNILLPFILGGFIAFIVNVLMVRVEQLWSFIFAKGPLHKLQRPASLIISLALIAAFFAFAVLLVLPELQSSVKTLSKLLPPAIAKFNVFLQEKAVQFNVSQEDIAALQAQWNEGYRILIEYIQTNKSLLLSRTWSATTSVVDLVTNFVIGIVAAVYLLLEKDVLLRNLKRLVYAFCTRQRADYLTEAGETARRIFTGFVAGQLTEAFILGCLCFVGMLVLGLPYALVVSVLTASLGLIPILGTFVSAAVGCFLILVAAPEKIWFFIVFFLVLQRIEGDFLYPKIVGKAVGLSELWVLAAVTIGGSIWGIVGMVIGVPTASVAYTLLAGEVRKRLAEKKLQDLQ